MLRAYKYHLTPIVQEVNDDGRVIGEGPMTVNGQPVKVECFDLDQIAVYVNELPEWLAEQQAPLHVVDEDAA